MSKNTRFYTRLWGIQTLRRWIRHQNLSNKLPKKTHLSQWEHSHSHSHSHSQTWLEIILTKTTRESIIWIGSGQKDSLRGNVIHISLSPLGLWGETWEIGVEKIANALIKCVLGVMSPGKQNESIAKHGQAGDAFKPVSNAHVADDDDNPDGGGALAFLGRTPVSPRRHILENRMRFKLNRLKRVTLWPQTTPRKVAKLHLTCMDLNRFTIYPNFAGPITCVSTQTSARNWYRPHLLIARTAAPQMTDKCHSRWHIFRGSAPWRNHWRCHGQTRIWQRFR